MSLIFSILLILASVVMIFLVVIQKSKGGGLATDLTGGAALAQQMGVRRATDFVEKATWYVISLIALLAFLANMTLSSGADPQEAAPQQFTPISRPAATPQPGGALPGPGGVPAQP